LGFIVFLTGFFLLGVFSACRFESVRLNKKDKY
jgi:hypothetical protein